MDRSPFRSMLVLLLIIVGVSACSEDQPAQEPGEMSLPTGKTVVYNCDESSGIVVKVDSTDAWFILEDTTVHLPQVVSASGARFKSGDYLYWSKGEEAMIEIPTPNYTNCYTDREESVWADAKLRGVTFRATGFEPGWYLEVYPDSIRYVLDYGERTLTSPTPEPKPDPENEQTIYDISTNLHDISIRITEESCTSPSGKLFPSTAYLTVDGKEYRGCGRFLR